ALEAVMDGFEVIPMDEAIQKADFVVTTTGNRDIVRKDHLKKIKDGAILANSGHFNIEIDLEGVKELATQKTQIREGIMEYKLENNKKFYVLAEGRLVNLASPKGFGHPVEVMDLSFSLQSLSIKHLIENPDMKAGVHKVPPYIDEKVAKIKLDTLDVEVDELTDKQKEYLSSWKSGT
ncbi:adenosylhomocysteinase, partial [archaeon SCG-AAA382B04]